MAPRVIDLFEDVQRLPESHVSTLDVKWLGTVAVEVSAGKIVVTGLFITVWPSLRSRYE